MDQQIYSSAQREAMASTYICGTTAGRVVELAGAGALAHPSGAKLGPFDTTENTVRTVARRKRLREAARVAAADTLDLPAQDAVERLRGQLVAAIDMEL